MTREMPQTSGPFQGEVIRIARWRQGMTQPELAERSGVSQSVISRLERGLDTDPPLQTVVGLTGALTLWPSAVLPWSRRDTGNLALSHSPTGNLNGRLATHFLCIDGKLTMCLRYCLNDAMRLRPDVCGLSVMQMDLVNNNFLVFTNARTDQINVIYRLKDGHYGLIQPSA